MHLKDLRRTGGLLLLAAVLLAASAGDASAGIQGISGTTFNLTAKADRIGTPEGGSYLLWGLANGTGRAQYPAPTLIVAQNATITVTLTNALPTDAGGTSHNVSRVFPGQANVTAACAAGPCVPGALTLEAGPNGRVIYTFSATKPGTFAYHSGTRPDLQVEMGITGAIVVQSSVPNTAYGDLASAFDREYLFFLSEIDPRIHETVELSGVNGLRNTDYLSDYFSNYWFINGRAAPDTMNTVAQLFPTQPYDSMPRMLPGERLLMRVVGGGSQFHPFHHHGNHARIIGRDGRPLDGTTAGDKALSYEVFTIQSGPGQTYDAIFEWTGKGLGWDMYGHTAAMALPCTDTAPADGYEDTTKEWCADHNLPFPVTLPDNLNIVVGGWWSGSPFLGSMGTLPPGEGGLNPNAGYAYMWHSHTEKELTNFDVFPGGMFTMLIIEPPGVLIP